MPAPANGMDAGTASQLIPSVRRTSGGCEMANAGRVGALVAFAAGLLLMGRGAADEPDFVSELNRARQIVAEEASARAFYEGPFNKAFYAQYPGWLNQCTQRTGQSLADFDMLVSLSRRGQVQAVRFEPRGDLTKCFADLVSKEHFPEPPSAWLTLPVSIRIQKP
jgi:hypothetical protein